MNRLLAFLLLVAVNLAFGQNGGSLNGGGGGGGGGGSTPTKVIWFASPGLKNLFVPDSGCKALYVECVGGGGGSAGALGTATSCAVSGGGSGGGYAAKYYGSPLKASYSMQVGSGGSQGDITTAGGNGTDSSFDSGGTYVAGPAGLGSPVPTAGTAMGISGHGGIHNGNAGYANGDIYMQASEGGAGIRFSATDGYGGVGGTSVWSGLLGQGYTINSNAGAGGNPIGGGGQGSVSTNATGVGGVPGGNGAIKITEFF